LDVQGPVLEVFDAQPGELPAPRSGVRGQADQEQVELGTTPAPCRCGAAGVVRDRLEEQGLGGAEQDADAVVADRAARCSATGSAHRP